jgi:hypothetical protein
LRGSEELSECVCVQHTRYRVKGRPKVASQTVEAVTSNGRDWYPDEAEDEEAEEDEDTAFRRYLTGAPGANLTDGVLDKLVETRETKLEELLQILEAGADDPGFVGARDVLVNALLVLVLTAVHRAQQDLEEEDGLDEEEAEVCIAVCDVTGTDLGFGDWFHCVGEDYDLCRAEHAKLSPPEQQKFVEVKRLSWRQDLGDDIEHFQHMLEDGNDSEDNGSSDDGDDDGDDDMDEDDEL